MFKDSPERIKELDKEPPAIDIHEVSVNKNHLINRSQLYQRESKDYFHYDPQVEQVSFLNNMYDDYMKALDNESVYTPNEFDQSHHVTFEDLDKPDKISNIEILNRVN